MNESRYRLLRPLSMGGMAELFLGVARGAEGFEKTVAIKRVLPHLAQEPAIARMFLAEARLATHLQHQNIATVYDVGSSPEGLFLVMELVNGWDLGVLLRHALRRQRRFPPHLVAFIGTQVLAGLAHAYRRQHAGRPVLTAHRDISPSNILVSREGEVKVTDFGIARVEGASMGTQPGTFKGKLPYSAPEALRGEPATALSDQFSLGIVLYELLAGRHPFGNGEQEPMAYAMAILGHEPPPLPPDVPTALATGVQRSLAKEPAARFAQPEDMAEALARYLAQAVEPATSHALASFITQLRPPLTLVEQGEAAEPPPSPTEVDQNAPTVARQPLPTRAVNAVSFGLQPVEDWEVEVGGPVLSTSGRRVTAEPPPPAPAFRCVRCAAPLPSAHAPCDACAQALAGFTATAGEPVTPRAPPPLDPSPAASAFAPPGARREELQLEERAPRPVRNLPATDAPSPWYRRWVRPLVKLLVLVAVAGAILKALPYLQPRLNAVRYSIGPKPQALTLSIDSEPSGATVSVDGTVVGTTPLFIDNIYPSSQSIPVQLTLKGYKPWKGSFTGGEPARLEVRLKR